MASYGRGVVITGVPYNRFSSLVIQNVLYLRYFMGGERFFDKISVTGFLICLSSPHWAFKLGSAPETRGSLCCRTSSPCCMHRVKSYSISGPSTSNLTGLQILSGGNKPSVRRVRVTRHDNIKYSPTPFILLRSCVLFSTFSFH